MNDKILLLSQQNLLKDHSRLKKWVPVTISEMYGFFLIWELLPFLILGRTGALHGLAKFNFFGNFFLETDLRLYYGCYMSAALQLVTHPRDYINVLVTNFKRNMHPSSNLSADETMVGFRGRFGAKQYIPNKPNKYGIKAFTIADSKNGYILDTLLYTGGDTLDNSDPQYSHLPQPSRVVLTLFSDYLEQGRTL